MKVLTVKTLKISGQQLCDWNDSTHKHKQQADTPGARHGFKSIRGLGFNPKLSLQFGVMLCPDCLQISPTQFQEKM